MIKISELQMKLPLPIDFKTLFQHLPGGIEKNYETTQTTNPGRPD
jgi:hypothetical protein